MRTSSGFEAWLQFGVELKQVMVWSLMFCFNFLCYSMRLFSGFIYRFVWLSLVLLFVLHSLDALWFRLAGLWL